MLHIEEHQVLEGLGVHQVRVLLVLSQLAVDEGERVQREARLLNGENRASFDHVLRRPVIELDSLDVVCKVEVLQDHGLDVHLIASHSFLDLFDGSLAGLILSLDCDDDPVIEDIEDLESLAGDLVQDKTGPGEEQVESHGEIHSLILQHLENLLVQG